MGDGEAFWNLNILCNVLGVMESMEGFFGKCVER